MRKAQRVNWSRCCCCETIRFGCQRKKSTISILLWRISDWDSFEIALHTTRIYSINQTFSQRILWNFLPNEPTSIGTLLLYDSMKLSSINKNSIHRFVNKSQERQSRSRPTPMSRFGQMYKWRWISYEAGSVEYHFTRPHQQCWVFNMRICLTSGQCCETNTNQTYKGAAGVVLVFFFELNLNYV